MGLEEGSIALIEEREQGVLIRPAVAVPVERVTYFGGSAITSTKVIDWLHVGRGRVLSPPAVVTQASCR